MRRGRAWAHGLLACALLVPLAALVPARAATSQPRPSQDPFYTDPPADWSSRPPGALLNHRTVHLAFGPGNSTPIAAEQLLYRTTGHLGQPTYTVTTVLRPPTAAVVPRIVGYMSFYDGLGDRCDPSYTLAGGDPGDSTYAQEVQEEDLLITWYLSQGDIVTVPDFEGTHLAWTAGRESGYGALDGIRATKSYLNLGAATPVGLSGYSGGADAADWASELGPAYAPDVNIVGVAQGGAAVNRLDHFAYIDGTAEYSAAIPAELLGESRAYGIDLTKVDPVTGQPTYLTPRGLQIVQAESDTCIASDFGKYQITIKDLLQPQYYDAATKEFAEPFASMLREQTMGTAASHPKGPILMAVGNSDGKGDGAMVAADVKALARKYCSEGVSVDYQEYPGLPHIEAAAAFEPQTGPFLQARFAGAPWVNNCATL